MNPLRPGKPKHIPRFLWHAGDAFMPKKVMDYLDLPFTNVYGADINGWTGMHVLSGVLLRILGFSFWQAFIIHAIWELFQIAIGMSDLRDRGESLDIIFDTTASVIGWWVADQILRVN